MELLERLVPLVPRPRINLLLYHGVLAPNASWRWAVVAREDDENTRVAVETVPPVTPGDAVTTNVTKRHRIRPRYRTWAELMRHAFEADVLACSRCGGG
jgi:hypothetical protein